MAYLDGVVRIGDERNEKAEDQVNEEADEGVQVKATEQPHQGALLLDLSEGSKHVVSVDQRKQAFGHYVQVFELQGQTQRNS